MHEQERVAMAERLQRQARQARAAGDMRGCLDALQRATQVVDKDVESMLHARLCWRLSKAAYDAGSPEQMLDAITPLIEANRAFSEHAPAMKAAEMITDRWWELRGYGDQRLLSMWADWSAVWRADDEPYMEAKGHIKGAWQRACFGDLDALQQLVQRYHAVTPSRFSKGSYRHPAAADTANSLPYVHLDLTRTALRAATWMHEERAARHMLDAFEDAMDESRQDRATDLWFMEPVLRAALAFGWREPLRWLPSYRALLASLQHERAPFHRALGSATIAQLQGRDPRAHLRKALNSTDAAHGQEWRAKVEIDAGNLEDGAQHLRRAARVIEAFHMRAFSTTLKTLRARL
ncbi:MAG: hypothetical protein ACI9MC_000117 [Kiritimatiellia bacterium]|jgi:hypothetical protein